MGNRKRKSKLDWDAIERQSLRKPALPLDDYLRDAQSLQQTTDDLSNGIEYLLSVRKEAENCPHVMKASHMNMLPDVGPLHEIRQWGKDEALNVTKMDESLLPWSIWHQEFIHSFQKTRTMMTNFEKSKAKIQLPKDENGWKQFLYPSQNGPHLPTFKELSLIDSTLALQLIEFHLNWIQHPLEYNQAIWIYSLLLKLDLLTADQLCVLRRLARKCIDLRSMTNSTENDSLAYINIILSIIGEVHGQFDLLDLV